MYIGEIFETSVRDLTSSGQGVVAHASGMTVFVGGVWLGERVRVRVEKIKGRLGFAALVELIEASPDRIEPICPHHGLGEAYCGGCAWQFVRYEAQLEAKQSRIFNAMQHIGQSNALRPILPSLQVRGYRNRAQFKSDGESLGYLASESHTLVDIDSCLILTDKNQHTFSVLRSMLPNRQWRVSKKEKWVSLDIDESIDAELVSVNTRLPFQQANTDQNAVMKQWLKNKCAGLSSKQNAMELFCGSGNFTEVLVECEFEYILAIEAVAEAMATLAERGHVGVETLEADLFLPSSIDTLKARAKKMDVLVLDPPRDGMKHLAELIPKNKKMLRDIFYISCNLATFTRDLKALIEKGYRVEDLQPIDQFPHTPHIELMAHFRR